MPEGPEAHLIAQQLADETYDLEVLESDYVCLVGSKLNIYAQGKKIVFQTEGMKHLVLSLGMDSRFSTNFDSKRFVGQKPNLLLRTEQRSYYWKTFQFGTAEVVDNLKLDIGPDLLTNPPTEDEWYSSLQRRKNIAAFLLDQKVWSGIGNYIRSEAFFLSNIDPRKKCNELTRQEANSLLSAIVQVMNESLALGCSSGYRDLYGQSGKYRFRCYKQDGTTALKMPDGRYVYVFGQ